MDTKDLQIFVVRLSINNNLGGTLFSSLPVVFIDRLITLAFLLLI